MPNLKFIVGGTVLLSLCSGVVWLMATAEGPWDRVGGRPAADEPATVSVQVSVGMDRYDVPRPNWVAKGASIGTREDSRREGALIIHKVLLMRGVDRPPRVIPANATLIYADSEELTSRVDRVLDGAVPVKPGLEALFAIGRLVPARIVRLGPDGRVRSVEDARVSFVGFSLEESRGQ